MKGLKAGVHQSIWVAHSVNLLGEFPDIDKYHDYEQFHVGVSVDRILEHLTRHALT